MAQKPPARQQVDPSPPQLSRAGSRKDETPPGSALDQVVHDVQQFGDPLHLVDQDLPLFRCAEDGFGESLRARAHLAVDIGLAAER